MADASKLQQGSIVWVSHAPDRQGRNPKPELRPFIILNATVDIKPGAILVGVAVTSTFIDPVPKTHIAMRWNAAGTTETGFRRKCFAVADWAHKIPLSAGPGNEIQLDGQYEGRRVRKQELLKILEARENIAAVGQQKPRE